MKKTLLLAGLAAIAGISTATVPNIQYVKSIRNQSINGVDPLAGMFISAVAADDNTLFYSASGSAVSTLYALPVVKISNWASGTMTRNVIFTDNNTPDATPGALGQLPVALEANGGNLYFATSLGTTNTSRNGTEVYRIDYDGNLVTTTGNFLDGILNLTPVNEFNTTAGSQFQDFNIDPGFSGGDSTLAHLILGSRSVRRNTLTDGATQPFLGYTTSPSPLNTRALCFDENGNAFFRINNDIYRSDRTAQNGDTFTGLTNPVNIVDLTDTSAQFVQVAYIPSAEGADAFLLANDYSADVPAGTGRLIVARASDGSRVGYPTITGTPDGEFAAKVMNFSTTVFNDTRYIFVTSLKANSASVIDVFQVGEAGKVSGTVNLQNFSAIEGQNVVFEVLDGDGNVLETRTIALGAGGSYSFISTNRGAVTLRAKGSHWLAQAASTSLSSAPATVNFSLINGDVDGDNEVAPNDFSVLAGAFGNVLGDPGYVASADLDGDEEVGPSDFSILAANFGLSGD